MNASSNLPPDSSDDEINLSDLLDTLLQHIWLIVGITVVITGIGVAYALLATPIYRADALIQVEDDKGSPLSSLQMATEALLGSGSTPITGEIEIIRSREVLLDAINNTQADLRVGVANRFPLIGDWFARRHVGAGVTEPLFGLDGYAWGGEVLDLAEFSVPPQLYGRVFLLTPAEEGFRLTDENGIEVARGPLHQRVAFDVAGGAGHIAVSRLQAGPGAEFSIVRQAPITAYRGLRANLNVSEAGRGSNIISLNYEHPNVMFAGEIVNAIASAYLKQNVERRSAEADKSLEFLDGQLPEIRSAVSQAEDALNTYKTKSQTVSVGGAAESLLQQAVATEQKRRELLLTREELSQRYRPNHPNVRAVDEQLEVNSREADQINTQINALPSAQRDLLRLQRDADVSTQLYIAMLNNAQQLRVAKAGTVGNVRIIDFAIPDTLPVAPKKTMIVAIAGLLGLMLGVMAAFALRLLRPTLRDAEEAERQSGLSVFASIPESPAQEKLVSHQRGGHKFAVEEGRAQLLALTQPEDPAVESLRSLRTGLAFALMSSHDKNIVITGPTAALGKSFIAANLSTLLAAGGKRVLLIETDLRKPQLGRYFGYNKVAGLSNVLAGTAVFDAVLRRDVVDGLKLDVLPAGQLPPNPGELLLSEGLAELLNRVQDDYDHIVLDSAPVLPVADTLAVVRHASTTFMVARAEHSTARELRDAIRRVESVGADVKGIIFNGIKRRRVGYGYAYKYYYGYK
ncbi:MAG: polysaccharide biosynthesis tyrosine autokinase [Pigmentiphaga sp.]